MLQWVRPSRRKIMAFNWNQRPLTEGKIVITTIDAHAAGEPFRIITNGLPERAGASMLERRRFMHQHFDHIRRALMWEPRGHFNMYGGVVTPPVTPGADLGVLFMHNEGYSTMCGHGIIALVTTLVETGAIAVNGQQTAVNIDTPAGLVRDTAHLDSNGHVEGVSFYVILPADRVGLSVTPGQAQQLVAAGEEIKMAVNAVLPVNHPFEADLSVVYGTILTGPPEDAAHHSRNICVFANAEVDRSPTGTGVSARLALHHAKGEIAH